jgi:hypothetical protein
MPKPPRYQIASALLPSAMTGMHKDRLPSASRRRHLPDGPDTAWPCWMEIMETTGKSFRKALPVLSVAFQTVGRPFPVRAGRFQAFGEALRVWRRASKRLERRSRFAEGVFKRLERHSGFRGGLPNGWKGVPGSRRAFSSVWKGTPGLEEGFQTVGRQGGRVCFTKLSFNGADRPAGCPPIRVLRAAGRGGARGICAAPRRGTRKRGHQTQAAAGPAAADSFPPHSRTPTLPQNQNHKTKPPYSYAPL